MYLKKKSQDGGSLKKLNLLSIQNSKNTGCENTQRKDFVINLKEKIAIQALIKKQLETNKQEAKIALRNQKFLKLKLQMNNSKDENRKSFEA